MKNYSTQPEVALVIPVYNEAEAIEKVFSDWQKEFERLQINYNIIAVNDGSKDESLNKLQKLASQNPRFIVLTQTNQGHGAAILNGYAKALDLDIKWIVQCDSDNQILAQEFSKLWSQTLTTHFICGRRKNRHDPLIRKIMSAFMKFGVFILFKKFIPDPNCPFRIYESKFLKEALSNIPNKAFAPNIHLSIEAFAKLKKTATIDVTHQERQTGTPSLKGVYRLMLIGLRVINELFQHKKKLAANADQVSLRKIPQ